MNCINFDSVIQLSIIFHKPYFKKITDVDAVRHSVYYYVIITQVIMSYAFLFADEFIERSRGHHKAHVGYS